MSIMMKNECRSLAKIFKANDKWYKDIKNNLKRRRTKGKRMQQLLKRFYDVIKVRIRFANSQ